MTAIRRWFVLLALFGFSSTAWGHVLDEYLQATLVAIEPGDIRLQINLTPGVEIADKVLVLIDTNQDGAISKSEAAEYAELLEHDLAARLDGRELELKLTASNIPAPDELKTGLGIMQMEFALAPVSLAAGLHKLSFENRHVPSLGVYLLNAAKPKSETIGIIRQDRNKNQSTGEIEFAYTPAASSLGPGRSIVFLAVLLGVVFAGAMWLSKSSPRLS